MTVLAVLPPATSFYSNGYAITAEGVDVPDPWRVKAIKAHAEASGVALSEELLVIGTPIPGRVEAQHFDWSWHTPPAEIVAGSYVTSTDPNQTVGMYGIAYSNPGNGTDDWRWRAPVSAGTWRLYGVATRGPDRGIHRFDISYDGGATWKPLGTWDGYAAAITKNVIIDFAGLNVPVDGTALLRLRCPTRHANASAFFFVLSFLRFFRTA